jgi:branched-chain amino acid transport system permease protein
MTKINYKTPSSPLQKWLVKAKHFANHPYFPILLLGAILLLLQIIGQTGLVRPSTLGFINTVLIRYIVAVGFMLLLGYAGLASLGTAGFIGFGAYLMGYLYQSKGIGSELILVIGILLSLLIGSFVGIISLRIEGMYLAIITLGISEIFRILFNQLPFLGQATGLNLNEIYFLGIRSSLTERYNSMYYVIVVLLILIMIWIVNIINSPTGRAMLSIKNSTSAAQAMGISIFKYRVTAFLVATMLAVLAGMLHMLRTTTSNPINWGIDLSLNILAAVVIGGTKNIWGVLIGTFIIYGLKDLVFIHIPFFQTYKNAYLMVNGLLIILVVMFYPGGVIRMFTDLKNFFKKWFRKLSTLWKEYRYGKDFDKH